MFEGNEKIEVNKLNGSLVFCAIIIGYAITGTTEWWWWLLWFIVAL